MTLNLINQGTDAEFTTNAKMKKQRPKPFKQKPAASPYEDTNGLILYINHHHSEM